MMKKHCYEIVINKSVKKYKEVIYDYSASRGKGIKLHIANNAIRIIAHLSSLYDNEGIVVSTNSIFSDAIKKALMLHMIIYSINIRIKSVTVAIDGEKSNIPILDGEVNPPIYSLVADQLARKIPEEWDNPAFFSAIVSRTRSNQDTRWAALYATICAKNKSYEIERFIYLWMALNGIYNYFASLINAQRPTGKNGSKPTSTEKDELTWLLRLYEFGKEHVAKKDSKRIADAVIEVVKRSDTSTIKGFEDITEEMKRSIEKVLTKTEGSRYDTTAYGYLLISFAYYFRCNVFHANKPLPMFCYSDETELKCLRLINGLLEDFIDRNLHKLFDDTFIEMSFGEKISFLAKS